MNLLIKFQILKIADKMGDFADINGQKQVQKFHVKLILFTKDFTMIKNSFLYY